MSTRTDTRFPYTMLFRCATMACCTERQLALAAIAARFGQQAFDALAPVGVEPAFNGLLAQMAAAGTGNVVLALGKFPHDRSEEHASELQSLMRISYAFSCLNKNNKYTS